MPLDPTLAELKPNLPKSFLDLELPSDFTSDTISLLIKSIDQNLEENGLSFLALPLTIGDSYLAELTVYRLACFNDNQLIANKLFNLAHSYKGAANRRDLKSQGFSKNSECPVEDFEQLFDKEAAAVSVAGRMYPARPGYLHPELTLGELVLPLSTRKDKIIQIIPNEGKLQLDLGGLHFGTWEYWNSFWKPTYLSGFHHYASMLAVKDSRVKELWTFTPTKYTWVWRLKMLDVLDYRDHKVLETYGIVEC